MGPVAVVGLGLIGTSIFLAARRAWPDATILGFDRGDRLERLRDADVVILAMPVDAIRALLIDEAASLAERALVLDAGSTKKAILAAARQAGLRNFVGGHPMAGGTSSGPSAARADLFDGRPWFLIPAFADAAPIDRARSVVAALGAQPMVMTDDGSEHDHVMAAVSHLPQVVASVLMVMAAEGGGERGLAWAGAGLRDTTRLASSSATMWESILASNSAEIRPLLEMMADRLRAIARQLDDPTAVRDLFARAAEWRRQLADQ
jgi:prephenate dehydrogenase